MSNEPKKPIIIQIDVKKLLKEHFVEGKPDRTGHKPVYCDLLLFPSSEQKYGNTHFVVQGVSQEARKNGVRGPSVGNAKLPEYEASAPQIQRKPMQSNGPSRYSHPKTDDSGDGEVDF